MLILENPNRITTKINDPIEDEINTTPLTTNELLIQWLSNNPKMYDLYLQLFSEEKETEGGTTESN